MRIILVHTPMFTVPVEQRRPFWKSFDIQYHAAHLGLRHMRHNKVLDLYTAEDLFANSGSMGEEILRQMVNDNPGDVYLFSPMTVNLHFSYQVAQAIKQIDPHALIIYGGVAATPLAHQVAALHFVDCIVTDRGEIALPELLKTLNPPGDAERKPLLYRHAPAHRQSFGRDSRDLHAEYRAHNGTTRGTGT